jgi:hypothetical protein
VTFRLPLSFSLKRYVVVVIRYMYGDERGPGNEEDSTDKAEPEPQVSCKGLELMKVSTFSVHVLSLCTSGLQICLLLTIFRTDLFFYNVFLLSNEEATRKRKKESKKEKMNE